jgi:RimJ/RimL family protein N-acetyltransferase
MIKGFDQLQGKKVFLGPFLQSDITSEYVSWLNDPEVVRYSNQRFSRHTKKSCNSYWESFQNTSNLFLIVRMKSGGLPIGTITAYFSQQHGTVDMGIMIGQKTTWGMGYGQDAWETLLNWLLNSAGVRKVTAGTLSCNDPMRRIIEKSGMCFEGLRRQQEIVEGVAYDLFYYGKLGNGLKR